MPDAFDVLVIGGGHAGAEAARAAARLGARTALVTFSRDAIGRMSCNPAIGGIGKGQMVREIDALGGLMGRVADGTGIQFRMLNRRKGPAMWAPRCQSDQQAYARAVQRELSACPNLAIIEAGVERIDAAPVPPGWARASDPAAPCTRRAESNGRLSPAPPADGGASGERATSARCRHGSAAGPLAGDWDLSAAQRSVTGVTLSDGRRIRAEAVVVTSGTFLGALMHTGEARTPGGRVGESAATALSASLRELGLTLGRLKTGTPPRLARDSIDFSALAEQHGDSSPTPFSFLTERIDREQARCWITFTNGDIHELIRANLHRAPMYSGQIASTGPRYCPSIEDKIVRFADKREHQVFLEPEGLDSDRIYCNGISTSLPQDVQRRIVAGIRGLERARIVQWGYAVEYDFVPPEQTLASLMTKRVAGLFLAGQINGTSGYEEAAGQGLVAGLNAARYAGGAPPVVLGRDQAYIGVMIDDLVTRGVLEPYRMFTSRAEHRLHLRYDNADQRLTPLGRELGLVSDERWAAFQARRGAIDALRRALVTLRYDGRPLAEWLKRPDEDGGRFVAQFPELRALRARADVWGSVLVEIRYAGYLERQRRSIDEFRSLEQRRIPADWRYEQIPHLRREALERWNAVRPTSVGQASRVSGIHPTDVSLLLVALERAARKQPATP